MEMEECCGTKFVIIPGDPDYYGNKYCILET